MSARPPRITTIIPTYRRPELLRRAIRSVLAQTVPDFQLCVYDNASGDETAAVVAEFARGDPRVRYYCQPRNIGPWPNFVFAIERVETPFFSLLSDDDVVLPDFYRVALDGFERHPEAVMSATAAIAMDDKGRVKALHLEGWQPGLYEPPQGLLAMLRHRHPAWTGALLRRGIVQDAGGLDLDTGSAADLDLELRIAARFPIVVSLEPCAIWVIHPGSWTTRQTLDAQAWIKLIQNIGGDAALPADTRSWAVSMARRKFRDTVFAKHSWGAVLSGDWKGAEESADFLRDYFHLRGRALLLRVTARVCKLVPPALYLLRAAKAVLKVLRSSDAARLQGQFGGYYRYLQT
jgi:glycosyltransferase involved in cell wall biosynthesis